jgi:DNA-binding LacI/PurR family transcriptional regulator
MRDKSMKTVRLQDIADALGISVNTVSRALRNCSDISGETITKVKAKAKEVGYITNNIASYLVNGKTSFVAIVFPSLQNPYYLIMITKLLDGLKKKGLDGLLFPISGAMDYAIVEKVLLNRCGGVISFSEFTEEIEKAFEERHLPLLLLGSNSPFPYVDCVYTDDYDGGRQVAKIFASSDSKKALYVGNAFTETSKRRASGFLDELKKENCRKKADTYFLTDEEYHDFSKMFAFIRKGNYDFIFTHNDELAINIRRSLIDPEKKKVRLFGYDNVSSYLYVCERVDSVGSDYDEIAQCSADLMAKRFFEPSEEHNIRKVFPVSVIFNPAKTR